MNRTPSPGAFIAALPKQHGAWTVLIACFVIGSCAGPGFGLKSVILLVSVIAAFFARAALGLYLCFSQGEEKRKGLIAWIMFYSGMLILSGAWLMARYELWLLGIMGVIGLSLAAFSLASEKDKKDMTLAGQAVNILGLSLIAPAGEYCASGSYSLRTLGVWLICALFFLGSLFYVRFLVRKRLEARGEFMERLRAGFPSLVFHLGALLGVGVLSGLKILPLLTPLVLAPALLRALWPIIQREANPLPVKLIGRRELVNTLIFLIIAILIFRLDAGGWQV